MGVRVLRRAGATDGLQRAHAFVARAWTLLAAGACAGWASGDLLGAPRAVVALAWLGAVGAGAWARRGR